MARETKTIQCYPDDNIINERIRAFEAFGWELINNQRCQEFDGQTKEYDLRGGSTTYNHYSTFNKLTFSRDRSAMWYREVVALEDKYNEKDNEIDRLNSLKPSKPKTVKTISMVFSLIIAIIFAAIMIFVGILGGAPTIVCIIWGSISAIFMLIFIIMVIRKHSKKKKYEAGCLQWERNYHARIANLKQECKWIMDDAQKVIDSSY